MKRIPEPELMEDEAQAVAYASADFSESNGNFAHFFGELVGEVFAGHVLDLGCGPGEIVLRLARAYPRCTVLGLDGSAAMLRLAEQATSAAPDCAGRIAFVHDVLPGLGLPRERYDAVVSNSLLHHLPLPGMLWDTMRRRAQPGAALLMMDLFRPATPERARELVAQYAAGEAEVLKRDFLNSLHAAFTPDEIKDQLVAAGLAHLAVRVVSDRHVLVSGRLP